MFLTTVTVTVFDGKTFDIYDTHVVQTFHESPTIEVGPIYEKGWRWGQARSGGEHFFQVGEAITETVSSFRSG